MHFEHDPTRTFEFNKTAAIDAHEADGNPCIFDEQYRCYRFADGATLGRHALEMVAEPPQDADDRLWRIGRYWLLRRNRVADAFRALKHQIEWKDKHALGISPQDLEKLKALRAEADAYNAKVQAIEAERNPPPEPPPEPTPQELEHRRQQDALREQIAEIQIDDPKRPTPDQELAAIYEGVRL